MLNHGADPQVARALCCLQLLGIVLVSGPGSGSAWLRYRAPSKLRLRWLCGGDYPLRDLTDHAVTQRALLKGSARPKPYQLEAAGGGNRPIKKRVSDRDAQRAFQSALPETFMERITSV